MSTLLGSIEHFDPQSVGIQEYVKRVEQYFEANGVVGEAKKDQRCSEFLMLVGAATYKLVRNLLEPDKPKDKTFEQLVEKLTDHYCPEPVEIMERFRFYSRVRRPGSR